MRRAEDRSIERLKGTVLVALVGLLAAGCGPAPLHDDFEGPVISSANWQLDMDRACRYEIVDLQKGGGSALRIDAPAEARCEITPKLFPDWQRSFVREPFGEERWYRFSVYVEDMRGAKKSDDITDNTIVAQWHSSPDYWPRKEASRGPPLALRIHNGRWGITYGWDRSLKSEPRYLARRWHWVGRVQTGEWIDWSFRIIWNYGDSGLTEVRKDGALVMQRMGPNAYNDLRGVYFKLGLYHPTIDKTIFLDRVVVTGAEAGESQLAPAGKAGPPGSP